MKIILLCLSSFVSLFYCVSTLAQSAPVIQYSQLYGGSQDDHPGPMVQTPDKGFVIAGWTARRLRRFRRHQRAANRGNRHFPAWVGSHYGGLDASWPVNY